MALACADDVTSSSKRKPHSARVPVRLTGSH
jgi:hypothetical protein